MKLTKYPYQKLKTKSTLYKTFKSNSLESTRDKKILSGTMINFNNESSLYDSSMPNTTTNKILKYKTVKSNISKNKTSMTTFLSHSISSRFSIPKLIKGKDPLKREIKKIIKNDKAGNKIIQKYKNLFECDIKDREKMNRILKYSNEMASEFYLKYRDAIVGVGKSSDVYSGVIKDPRKLRNKIMLDFKNFIDINEEDIKNNKVNYERNLEYIDNQYRLIQEKRLEEARVFERMKNKKSYFFGGTRERSFSTSKKNVQGVSESNNSNSVSKINSSLYVNLKNNFLNGPINKRSGKNKIHTIKNLKEYSTFNFSDNSTKLENIAKQCLLNIKNLLNKKIEKNSEIFTKALSEIGFKCQDYEKIDKTQAELNLKRNILVNKTNLNRVIKVLSILDFGHEYDDAEENPEYVRIFGRENDFHIKKLLAGYVPKFAKTSHFLKSTTSKFNQLQGRNFGLPC